MENDALQKLRRFLYDNLFCCKDDFCIFYISDRVTHMRDPSKYPAKSKNIRQRKNSGQCKFKFIVYTTCKPQATDSTSTKADDRKDCLAFPI